MAAPARQSRNDVSRHDESSLFFSSGNCGVTHPYFGHGPQIGRQIEINVEPWIHRAQIDVLIWLHDQPPVPSRFLKVVEDDLQGFKRWLRRRFFETSGGAPNSEALQSALNVIEANAHFDGPEQAVFIRTGCHEGKLYLDLCDEAWRAVEIGPNGWRVIINPPVRFRRANPGIRRIGRDAAPLP